MKLIKIRRVILRLNSGWIIRKQESCALKIQTKRGLENPFQCKWYKWRSCWLTRMVIKTHLIQCHRNQRFSKIQTFTKISQIIIHNFKRGPVLAFFPFQESASAVLVSHHLRSPCFLNMAFPKNNSYLGNVNLTSGCQIPNQLSASFSSRCCKKQNKKND